MTTIELTLGDIEKLAREVFTKNGCDKTNTAALVQTVVAAECDGAMSHGLFRVPGYIASLRSGKVRGDANPRVENTTPALIRVDGDNGFTPLSIKRGIPALTTAAKTVGIAAMTITNTHHFAALWPETEAIAAHDLIGLACVCYMPFMAPFGGNRPLFGTNPISFAWPRPGKNPMVIDMATAAMAQGEIQIAARDGHKVPLGTGLNASGDQTTDASDILKGMLLPFGGYKGSAIALMVELLAAGATGEQFSFEAVKTDNGDGGPPRGGEFFLAISPEMLAGSDWVTHCEEFFAKYESIDGARLPGQRRHNNRMSDAPRKINRQLVEQIESLCDS